MFRKNYTDNDIILAIKESKSFAQVMRKVGLIPAGGNYSTMKRKAKILNIDTSHFTGKLWNKDCMLKEWESYSSVKGLKKQLIKERGYICEKCGITKWFGERIKIEIHHVDGDITNNSLENIQLLCPNCHSITNTWKKTKETLARLAE